MAVYVEQAVQSVLSQDYPRIEYIVVDGGSTDGTLEILRKYEGRLLLISGKDNGAADAVNRGFRLSRGEIFAYLNADDYLSAGSGVARRLRPHGASGCRGRIRRSGMGGRVWPEDRRLPHKAL